ncbi:hypothetical protein [Neptuniibacter sp. QD37_11]|uniref:hypothetical protein n=1 Tax=Neptuniibacter sp. QD37_11 TaxID=3398209 RepID=UPI0039F47323
MPQYNLITDCVSAEGEDISRMIEFADDIDAEDFKEKVGAEAFAEISKNFGYIDGEDLTLESDWSVSFAESTYNGAPCLYIRHSAIEYVYVDNEHTGSILYDDELSSYHEVAEIIDDHLAEATEFFDKKDSLDDMSFGEFCSTAAVERHLLEAVDDYGPEFEMLPPIAFGSDALHEKMQRMQEQVKSASYEALLPKRILEELGEIGGALHVLDCDFSANAHGPNTSFEVRKQTGELIKRNWENFFKPLHDEGLLDILADQLAINPELVEAVEKLCESRHIYLLANNNENECQGLNR